MNIQHMILREFKTHKNATETAKKICFVYGQRLISDHKVQNWFSMFCSEDTTLRNELSAGRLSNLDQDRFF